MRQYAIIGLGNLGISMLEALSEVQVEIVIIDRESSTIERWKDLATNAFITDAIDEEALRRILPEGLDAAIVDLGDNIEAAILVTNVLKRLGIAEIIVKADSERRGEILELVGATRVVYPDQEAAARIVPRLVSKGLFSFMPIGSNLVIAEVRLPDKYAGMTLIEANLRKGHDINVVALRSKEGGDYRFFAADHRLGTDDVLLVAGTEHNVILFAGAEDKATRSTIGGLFKKLLEGKKTRGGNP
jgi:trk system potassium uptake protein TrkA